MSSVNGLIQSTDTAFPGDLTSDTSGFGISTKGNTMRVCATRNPASNAVGYPGEFCFGTSGGTTYIYYCIASTNWGRAAFTTGY